MQESNQNGCKCVEQSCGCAAPQNAGCECGASCACSPRCSCSACRCAPAK